MAAVAQRHFYHVAAAAVVFVIRSFTDLRRFLAEPEALWVRFPGSGRGVSIGETNPSGRMRIFAPFRDNKSRSRVNGPIRTITPRPPIKSRVFVVIFGARAPAGWIFSTDFGALIKFPYLH